MKSNSVPVQKYQIKYVESFFEGLSGIILFVIEQSMYTTEHWTNFSEYRHS